MSILWPRVLRKVMPATETTMKVALRLERPAGSEFREDDKATLLLLSDWTEGIWLSVVLRLRALDSEEMV